MYSLGHGDGINLYAVAALPMLLQAFQDFFPSECDKNKYTLDAVNNFFG